MMRVHITVHGRVQGVFFRAGAREKAQSLGNITGWVANQGDGTLAIEAEGPENKLKDFSDWCYSGPPSSEVTKVDLEWHDYTGEFDSFDIRY